jgi:hypothetical protein
MGHRLVIHWESVSLDRDLLCDRLGGAYAYYRALEADRHAIDPPPGLPPLIWGAPLKGSSGPAPWFAPGASLASLWAEAPAQDRLHLATQLLDLGLRPGVLVELCPEEASRLRRYGAWSESRGRTGRLPQARQVFRYVDPACHANVFLDAFHVHAVGPFGSARAHVEIFLRAWRHYDLVAPSSPNRLDMSAAWTVASAELRGALLRLPCFRSRMFYATHQAVERRASLWLSSGWRSVTPRDRVRCWMVFASTADVVAGATRLPAR